MMGRMVLLLYKSAKQDSSLWSSIWSRIADRQAQPNLRGVAPQGRVSIGGQLKGGLQDTRCKDDSLGR